MRMKGSGWGKEIRSNHFDRNGYACDLRWLERKVMTFIFSEFLQKMRPYSFSFSAFLFGDIFHEMRRRQGVGNALQGPDLIILS